MKKNSVLNKTNYSLKQTAQENSQSSVGLSIKVHVADVKSWKDNYEHENVRRQRQDLYDNWEEGNINAFAKR